MSIGLASESGQEGAVAAAPATLSEVARTLRARIPELERAGRSLENVLLGQGYIVVCQGVYLTFDVIEGYAINPRHAPASLCLRMTKRDAQAVAERVINGNNVKAEAIHVRDAIAVQLAELRDTLNFIETNLHKEPA